MFTLLTFKFYGCKEEGMPIFDVPLYLDRVPWDDIEHSVLIWIHLL